LRGRKAASAYPKQRTFFYTVKGKEIAKVDVSATYLEETLYRATKEFPNFDSLEPFYRDLYDCIVDTNELRKNLSSISSVAQIIKKLRRETIVRLKEMRYTPGEEKRAKDSTKAYIGRVSSLLKGLSKQIAYYNATAEKLLELPDIKTKEPCIIFAGFPNVGKSTLMKKITSSKVLIAPYPFTTKGLNVGIFMQRYMPIQVIDTPGLLDRPLHKRNLIELKAITALQYLEGMIVFVVDPTQELLPQKNLFDEVKKLFTKQKFIITINKTDIAEQSLISVAEKEFAGERITLEGNGKDTLKEMLLKEKIF
jgi:nucleolar GTP-binding protein